MFASDNSGIFWGLTSLIIIVFVGVGLSSLTQRRFEFSSSSKSASHAIQTEASVLSELTAEKKGLEERLQLLEKPRQEQAAEAVRLQETIRRQQAALEILRSNVAETKSAAERADENFAAYRKAYRAQTWRAAAGEKLPAIRLRSGREYRNVSILRVTPVGLEIDHADGRARLDSRDLDDTWQERFQWNDAERRQTHDEEERDRNRPDAPPGKSAEPTPVLDAPTRTAAPPAASNEEIAKLRAELTAWNYKVSQLDSQHSEARMKIAQGGSPSVPGSLETWSTRANRLGGDLNRARDNQVRARARLAIVAPGDPLLMP